MGKSKIQGSLALLLTLQTFAIPNYSWARNDGFKPQMPTINMDDEAPDNDDLFIPGFNYDNSNNGNNYNGNNNGFRNSPKRPLVRPDNSVRGFRIENATIRIADVSEEFACPLFDGKPYESIMNSLDKLSGAMRSTTQCNPSSTMGSVVDNTQKIRDAITVLKPYFEQPDMAFANLDAIESSISKAVVGIDGITQSLANPSFQGTNCGKNISANATVASSLSSLVTSLGPFALLGISMAPGLGIAVKAGALAIIAGASSYNEYQKLTYGQSVDMSDHEQWKAVVQNTCSYSRIVRKMNYIQRFESGLIPDSGSQNDLLNLPTEIQLKVVAFENKYKNNSNITTFINTSKADKKASDEIFGVLKMGRIELSRMSGQIGGDAKANPEIACSVGLEIARLAKNKTGFPSEIVQSIELLQTENGQNYSALLNTYHRLVDGLNLLKNGSLSTATEVNECANKTSSLISVLNRTITTYFSSAQSFQAERENQLLKNPAYKTWKAEATSVETQKLTGKRLYSVMKNIADSSAILRSYLNRRQNELRAVLLGPPNWISLTPGKAPPVYKWLDYTLNMHQASVKELMKNFKVLNNDLFNLNARMLKVSPVLLENADLLNISDKKYMEAFLRASRFEGLDIKNFNLRDPVSNREHQLVCRRLLNTWDSWIQATNHLDSLGVFCYMVDPLIDVMTDKSIVKFCRGSNLDIKVKSNSWDSISTESSVSLAIKNLLAQKTVLYNKSIEQVALMIPAKIKTMKCDVSGGL